MNRPPLELRHLRAFAAVIEHGGYTRAARALGVSQSTVSESVAALERRIGEQLLEKQGRSVVATESGRLVLETARRMIEAEAELDRELAARAGSRGAVRLGANESVSSYLLPAALAAARERWPHHEWSVTLGNCAALREKLERHDIDAAFVVEPAGAHAGRDRRAESLQQVELVLFVSPAHPLAKRKRVSLADVQRHVTSLSDAAGTYERLFRAELDRRGLPPPSITAIGSVEAVKRWVLEQRDAIGALPAFAVGSELKAGTLVALNLDDPLPLIDLRLIAREDVKPPVLDVATALRR